MQIISEVAVGIGGLLGPILGFELIEVRMNNHTDLNDYNTVLAPSAKARYTQLE